MKEYTTIRLAAPAGARPSADTVYREVLQLCRCDLIGSMLLLTPSGSGLLSEPEVILLAVG
jgi:hypothetical protein